MPTKPLKGQLSLIGETNEFELVYQPHLERSPQGEAIVVVRIPENKVHDSLYETSAIQASQIVARGAKTFKLDYRTIKRKKLES